MRDMNKTVYKKERVTMRDMGRMMKGIVTVGAMAFLLAGCGASVADDSFGTAGEGGHSMNSQEEQQTDIGNESKNADGTENSNGTGKMDVVSKEESTGAAVESAASKGEVKYTEDGVPIYGAKDKKAVKAYLESLPGEYVSFEKAKKAGVIRDYSQIAAKDFTKKQMKYFQDKWLSFYSRTKESDEIVKGIQNKDAGTVSGDAVVILQYTIEGDPIYRYISYTPDEGEYFLYIDSSRDNFSCRASREEGYSAVYDTLRWHLDAEQETTEFYLVKDGQEDWEKMLEEDYDSEKLFMAYNLGYLVEHIDGEMLCY